MLEFWDERLAAIKLSQKTPSFKVWIIQIQLNFSFKSLNVVDSVSSKSLQMIKITI